MSKLKAEIEEPKARITTLSAIETLYTATYSFGPDSVSTWDAYKLLALPETTSAIQYPRPTRIPLIFNPIIRQPIAYIPTKIIADFISPHLLSMTPEILLPTKLATPPMDTNATATLSASPLLVRMLTATVITPMSPID